MIFKLPTTLKSSGFTIVELLVVITIIGALAGVTLTVINSQQQRNIAEDSVKQSNLSKAAEGLESFYHAEGFYPDAGSNSNPLEGADKDLVAIYVQNWPSDALYVFDDDVSGLPEFSIQIQKSTTDAFFKYRSTTSTISECDSTTPPDDVTACTEIGGTTPPPTPAVESLAVTPATATVAVGGKQQFTATATFTNDTQQNVTSSSTWEIKDGTGGATIDSGGLATGSSVGSVNVIATYQGFNDSADLTITGVTPNLTSVTVAPSTNTISIGQAVQLIATAHFSDGSTQIITTNSGTNWTAISSGGVVVSVNNTTKKGEVTGVANGAATVTATYNSLNGSAAVTVSTIGGTQCTTNSQCVPICGCASARCVSGTCNCSSCSK